MLDSICYFMQYILLGALSGAFTNIIGLIRTLIFKYKLLNNKMIFIIILILYLIIGALTYNGIISILPVIAAFIYTSALWQDDIRIIRNKKIIRQKRNNI